MKLTLILSVIADLGIIGIIFWLIVLNRKLIIIVGNGGTVKAPRREELAWVRRHGRFKDMDRDSPETPQIMPGPLIPVTLQTHNGKEYRDGVAEDMDT